MTNSSEAYQRIEVYFGDFRAAIEKCRMAGTFIAADWQDAYARLARLRERYKKEKTDLTRAERAALFKVFEDDTFTKGMMEIRQVGEHVKRPGNFGIRTTSNAPITLTAESSAMAFFSASAVFLNDADGKRYRVDHLEMLEEMQKRIAAAMTKARL